MLHPENEKTRPSYGAGCVKLDSVYCLLKREDHFRAGGIR